VGVYAVGHRRLSGDGRLMAGLLACGSGAVLSHRSAGHVWGIRPSASRRIEVTVPRTRRGRPGIAMHRTRSLLPDEVAVHDGFPVTSVGRTLVDLAGVLRRDELAQAIGQAERLGLFDLPEIEAACARGNGRRGVRSLTRLLARYCEPAFTRSELERRFAALCDRHALPLPSFNVNLHGHEVDALWKDHRLVIELDGWEWHRTRAAFERDRRRDAELARAGYRVLRFTWRQLEDEPAFVAATVAQALGAAPPVNLIAPIDTGGQTTPLANRLP
jgi:hypothetical protein